MSFLDQILSAKRDEIAAARHLKPQAELERLAANARTSAASPNPPPAPACASSPKSSVRRPRSATSAPYLHPGDLALAYQTGGAAADSVLTERNSSRAPPRTSSAPAKSSSCPSAQGLHPRPYQVYETAARGADVLLLIVRILDDDQLASCCRSPTASASKRSSKSTTKRTRTPRRLAVPVVGINNRDSRPFPDRRRPRGAHRRLVAARRRRRRRQRHPRRSRYPEIPRRRHPPFPRRRNPR